MEAVKVKHKTHCKIGELLKAEGRTQKWLAEQISTERKKVTSQMVSDWVNNRYPPHINYILKIQRVTGWTLDQMFEEVEE
ncbi:helix-turn-helix transcriptional regulator [Paenibacillus alkalitolerans]|uniref:helix-turn-helix transcriptional regulator n=1 Tax=Paenibacillus alkalitolerans TaxID=2799335 RepID=UPI0018F7CA81|nr:helix-turn-helix transcriptional regulator [Paenibacillus alkalitolerans]